MFGNIKEYKVLEVTKKTLEKKKWIFDELDGKVVKEIEETLENKGFVFALGKKIDKKKIIKGVYIFKLESKDDEKVLIFDKKVFAEEIREEVIFEFEDAIDSVLGSAVSEKHVNKAVFGEKEFEIKKVKIGKYEVSTTLLWLIWGLITWILTDDVLWFCLGIVFGTSMGYVVKVNGKQIATNELKRAKKKESKKKSKKDEKK